MIGNKKRALALLLAVLLTVPLYSAAHALEPGYEPSNAYASGAYYERLVSVELSGNPRLDLINVALSQMGYHEGDSAAELGGENAAGRYDYTEYGYWYGVEILDKPAGHMGPWCAMFVSWCARRAGIPADVISNACYARIGTANPYYFLNLDFYEKDQHEPAPGDLAFFDWPNQSGEWNHVAIVYCVGEGRVYMLEGNTMHNNAEIRAFALDEPIIKGYAVPRYASDPGLELDPPEQLSLLPTYDYFDPINHIRPAAAISSGSTGDGVCWLQTALTVLGYPVGVTAVFDTATE
ncbi:MAG: CHAP domain-containing protein, partial [Clostridia bacterium]|nr:CHAP domain-containing protein [Clostridia bacterium]